MARPLAGHPLPAGGGSWAAQRRHRGRATARAVASLGCPTKACDSGEFYTDKHVTSRPSLPARPRSAAWPDAGVSHAPALAVSLARAGVEWLPVSSDRLYSCIYRQKPHGIREASAGATPWQGAPN